MGELLFTIASLCFVGTGGGAASGDSFSPKDVLAIQLKCQKYYANCYLLKKAKLKPKEEVDVDRLLLDCTVEKPEK